MSDKMQILAKRRSVRQLVGITILFLREPVCIQRLLTKAEDMFPAQIQQED